jgi:hypothetical protein
VSTGGASGGAIYLKATTFTGTGTIEANGGRSYLNSGGGSGGRIAIYYTNVEWSGKTTAYGGRAEGPRVGGV